MQILPDNIVGEFCFKGELAQMSVKVVQLAGCAIIVGQGTVSLVLEFGSEQNPLSLDEFNAVVMTALSEARIAGVIPIMLTEEDAGE